MGGHHDFTLTRQDALVWFGLRREVKGWRKLAMILWFALAGVALALAPKDWVGAPGDIRHWITFAAAFGVQFLLMTVFLSLRLRWMARRLIPSPRRAWFQDRGDHLAGSAPDGSPLALPAERIGQIIETPTHLFFSTPGSVLILPAHIFRDPAEKHALAQRWLGRIKEQES